MFQLSSTMFQQYHFCCSKTLFATCEGFSEILYEQILLQACKPHAPEPMKLIRNKLKTSLDFLFLEACMLKGTAYFHKNSNTFFPRHTKTANFMAVQEDNCGSNLQIQPVSISWCNTILKTNIFQFLLNLHVRFCQFTSHKPLHFLMATPLV